MRSFIQIIYLYFSCVTLVASEFRNLGFEEADLTGMADGGQAQLPN
jgi:hypothetical protein